METDRPTEQDLILALQELFQTENKRPDGSLRTKEIVEILRGEGLRIGRRRLRDVLTQMKKLNIIEVCPIPIKNLADEGQTVPGYRLVRKGQNDRRR